MTSATERLLDLMDAGDRYDIPYADLLPVQVEAANERLDTRIDQIPLLANRAEAGGVSKIGEPADLVPLLFAHTTYKSYSENWLTEGRWDRMTKWLQTVSTHPIDGIDLDGVDDLDDWLARLEPLDHYVTCSSGTTGKPAMLSCSEADLDTASQGNVRGLSWATGVEPTGDRKFFGLGPPMRIARNEHTRLAMIDAFSSRERTYQFAVDPISPSSIMAMITLRRRIADGTARPAELGEYERLTEQRERSMESAREAAIEALIDSRDERLVLTGMFGTLHPIAQGIRDQGYGPGDFDPENAMLVGGGLKGADLPPDYREFVLDTFNVAEERMFHLYSMQEINTPFPKCRAGRYHIAPWVIPLPLDATGEQLLDAHGGEIEARAAFFDISVDGRWGGVISGDRVSIDFGPCSCGHQGPTIGSEITRFADLPGGDKITCSGSIDAYVRGVA